MTTTLRSDRGPQTPMVCLLPVALSGQEDVEKRLAELERAAVGQSFGDLLRAWWQRHLGETNAPFALALVAGSIEELKSEIQLCRRTWSTCWTTGRDWKTPAGSYLCSQPIADSGKIAFVFPGIGSLYPGYSQDLLNVFPGALDNVAAVSQDELLSMIHGDQLWNCNSSSVDSWPFDRDIVSQAEATVSLAYVWTHLLQSIFQIRPALALGYSLGEIAMFASCGCWERPQELAARFRTGLSFRQSLAGEMSVFGKSDELRDMKADRWQACVASLPEPLQTPGGTDKSRVFITHINTPREVVVAGDAQDVADWLVRHQARGQVIPSRLVYHCRAVAPEATTLQELFELPVAGRPQADLVAMTPFAKVPHNSKLIARTLVNTALNTVDFPQIVQTAYQRGARIFVEVGPRNNCSTWIQQILAGQAAVTVSTDQKGFHTSTAVVRMLAKLTAHRVPVSVDGTWNWIRTLADRRLSQE